MKLRSKKQLLIVTAIVPYVVLCPLFNQPLYNYIMFRNRDRSSPAAFELQALSKETGATIKFISFPSSNGKLLKAWFFQNPNRDSKRTFLFSHGRGGNARRYLPDVQHLLALDASVLLYDYQGYGPSEGRASIENACDDAVAAYRRHCIRFLTEVTAALALHQSSMPRSRASSKRTISDGRGRNQTMKF